MIDIFKKKADEAFAQFDASGDDELDYKVEPDSLLTLNLEFWQISFPCFRSFAR